MAASASDPMRPEEWAKPTDGIRSAPLLTLSMAYLSRRPVRRGPCAVQRAPNVGRTALASLGGAGTCNPHGPPSCPQPSPHLSGESLVVDAQAQDPYTRRMYTRQTGWIAAIAGALLSFQGCGDDGSTATPPVNPGHDAGDGSAGNAGASGSGGGDASGGDAGSSACPSSVLCGSPAVCCAVGQECVAGACLAACPSAVRCEGSCCASGELCVAKACVSPGTACKDSFDCTEKEFCEPTIGKCLPQPSQGPECEYYPPALPFDPLLEWSWTGSSIAPKYDQVLSIPLVADLDGDTIPEVVIVTHDTGDGSCDAGFAYIRALDGRDGKEKWAASVDAYSDAGRVAFCRTPAIGDLDGDGKPEIVAARYGGGILALHGDGSLMWSSTQADGTTPYVAYFPWSTAVAIANMDGDGKPEVVAGGVILDAEGKLRTAAGTPAFGGGNAVVADVDGDGVQDVISGTWAMKLDGTVLWQSGQADGYPALGDLDGDGKPELVVISSGTARVQDAKTGVLLAAADMPGTGNGGPPTISDFDGDGVRDFASAVGDSYTIFKYVSMPAPAISVIWSVPTSDISSSQTGSSVFDFEGDGSSEVLYNDECYLRVYGGKDGKVLFETASSSGTASLYPVAVDVDGDNNTELVVGSDDKYQIAGMTPGCPSYKTGESLRHGVFVYGDKNDKWVRTRRIWNQHSYHITNIGVDGTVPAAEVASWGPAGFNSYRVSSQGAGAYNAPDLVVDMSVLASACPTALKLRARVTNQGSLGVPAGVQVAFFFGATPPGTALGTGKTAGALLPGQAEVVELDANLQGTPSPWAFRVTVDGANASESKVDECLENNNEATIANVTCPTIK